MSDTTTALAEWTFLVYMAGDNNLSAAGDRDLAEMRRVGSTPEVNIVAEFDNAGDAGTRRFRIGHQGAGEHVESLGETDSGSPAVLLDFIRWAATRYPAKRYALVLWNHGGGWAPTDMDQIAHSVNAASYSEGELAERAASPLGRAFFSTTLQSVFRLPGPAERAICSDDGTGHSLDSLELERVLAQGCQIIGQRFDLLGMDACLMSNVEVAYQVREHAALMVASEENEPNQGWPYDRLLSRLVDAPQLSATALAAHIVDDYLASYADAGFTGNVTQTAIRLDALDSLTAAIDALAGELTDAMAQNYASVWRAHRKTAHFHQRTLFDIGHWCERLAGEAISPALAQRCSDVITALAPAADKALLATGASGSKVQHCHGLSAYLVPPMVDVSRYYADLAFAGEFRWLPMLRAYHAI